MRISISLHGKHYTTDLSKGIDISIPLSPDGPRAWYVDKMRIEPVKTERFNGSVADGGDVNFRNIFFNPHAHGTHTETRGHIDRKVASLNKTLRQFFFEAFLVSLRPTTFSGKEEKYKKHGDLIITKEMISDVLEAGNAKAMVIRTLPNNAGKKTRNYSNTNPPYFTPEALSHIRQCGIKHLLVDLPSVDREEDGGKLLAHHAYWYGNRPDDMECTISEMVFVPKDVEDGSYLLNLQTAPFENDASPSRPVLYQLIAL